MENTCKCIKFWIIFHCYMTIHIKVSVVMKHLSQILFANGRRVKVKAVLFVKLCVP